MEQSRVPTLPKVASPTKFFKEVLVELKKVTWPSRKELISSTLTVLAVVVVFAVFLGVIDLILTALIGLYIK